MRALCCHRELTGREERGEEERRGGRKELREGM